MIDMAEEQRRRSVPLHVDALPRAVDAETALIDAALHSAAAREIALSLPPGALTVPQYQALLPLMATLHTTGASPDAITLVEAARSAGADADAIYETTQDVDGACAADEMADGYAKIIRERYEQRLVIQRVHASLQLMVSKPGEARHVARRLVESMVDFAAHGETGFVHAADAMAEAYDISERRLKGDTGASIRTGVAQFDGDPVGGLEPGDLATLVMVSGHGKTAVMAMLSLRAALTGTGVGFISAEMARRQIAWRWASLLTGIPFARMKHRDLYPGELQRAVYAQGVTQTLPLYIDDTGTPTLAHVVTQTRRLVQRHPDVRIICIDYLTLVQGNAGNSTENHNQVVRAMKRLAKELGIAIIGLVQPDARTIEKRGDDEQMPRLDDIAWCQEFRNQSDLIICGYRDGKARARHGGAPDDTFGAFRIAKSRNGGVAEWTWKWSGSTMAFDNGCWAHLDAMMQGDGR